jgi:hypothetical protein
MYPDTRWQDRQLTRQADAAAAITGQRASPARIASAKPKKMPS